MKAKILAVLLAAAALVWMALHVRIPYGTAAWQMAKPQASARKGETMNVSLPQGDVDINRAGEQELQKLAGVGPVLAEAIMAEREENGAFHYPEDLLNVKGIGDKVLEKMLEQLRLP